MTYKLPPPPGGQFGFRAGTMSGPMDFGYRSMLKALAEDEAAAHQEQLAKIRAQDKPSPSTVMTIDKAGLLIEAHSYENGEQIGVASVGDDRSMGYQALVQQDGEVVVIAGWTPSAKGRQAKLRPNAGAAKPIGWSVQAGRMVRKDEVA